MQKRQCRPEMWGLMLAMSLFVLIMNLLTLDDSVSIESRTGIIASAVLSMFLTVEQSESLLLLDADVDAAVDADVDADVDAEEESADDTVDPDATLAFDCRPLERFCRRASKEESSWPTLLSGPTSSKRLFMSVILPSVSSWRLNMDKVVALATDEVDSAEEVETEDESAGTVDPEFDADADADVDADVDIEEADSEEEMETEEETADTVDLEVSPAVLPGANADVDDDDAGEASADADVDVDADVSDADADVD